MVYQQIKEHHTIKISDGDQYYGYVARLKHKNIIVTSLERPKKKKQLQKKNHAINRSFAHSLFDSKIIGFIHFYLSGAMEKDNEFESIIFSEFVDI